MKLNILYFILFVLAAGSDIYAKPRKNISQKYGGTKIIVRQARPSSRNISGQPATGQAVQTAAQKFFAALDKLPVNFVKRAGLRYVTFLENPKLKNIPVGGVASGDTIVLSINCSERTVFHELFHIFDPLPQVKGWQNLNNKKFVYTGSQYYEEKLSRRKRKRKDQNLSAKKFDSDFVSRYAMSNEKEDRAETFAAMIVEKKNFLQRTRKSPVLQKKMKFIIDMTDKKKLIGKDFWKKHFGVQNLSAL